MEAKEEGAVPEVEVAKEEVEEVVVAKEEEVEEAAKEVVVVIKEVAEVTLGVVLCGVYIDILDLNNFPS